MRVMGLVAVLLMVVAGCEQSKVGAKPFVITEVGQPTGGEALTGYACTIKPSRGSGVNTKYGVLTCYHCISGGKPIEVACGGESATGAIIAIDSENDIALLAVRWKSPHPVAEIATTEPKVSETLRSAGRLRDGVIGVDRYRVIDSPRQVGGSFYTDNPFVGGQSGSALFNAKNEIVGIVRFVDMTDEPYRGVSSGVALITKLVGKSPVVQAPEPQKARKRRRAIIGTAGWCEPCKVFHSVNAGGNSDLELLYVDIEKPRPEHVTREEWDRVVSTATGMYGPGVEQLLPLAMWQASNGKWYSKHVGGWSTETLLKWVNAE
jgi:hypothetical protein